MLAWKLLGMKLRVSDVPHYVLAGATGTDSVQRRSERSACPTYRMTRCAAQVQVLLLSRQCRVGYGSRDVAGTRPRALGKLSVNMRVYQKATRWFRQR